MSVVDQNGSIKSDNVKATYDGTKWSTEKAVNYSPTYQYYAYYPYSTSGLSNLGTSSAKGSIAASGTSAASGVEAVASRTSFNAQVNSGVQAVATRAVSANTSASDFFASGISAFTPATNQSTAANFNASDLQVGKATINRLDATDIDFTAMSHAMGLAEISEGTSTDVFLADGLSMKSTNGVAVSSAKANNTFTGNIPYAKNGKNYAIVRTGSNTTRFIGNVGNGCLVDVTGVSANSVKQFTTTPLIYTLAIGDIYYSDGYVSHSSTHLDATDGKTPIGIVGYIGKNYWTEYDLENGTDTGSGHGGHALVICLRHVGSDGKTPTDYGTRAAWKEKSDTDEGRVKITSQSLLINSYKESYGSGYTETNAMDNAIHISIQNVRKYDTLSAPASKSTGWFVPTAGQWYAAWYAYGYRFPTADWGILSFVPGNKIVATAINNAIINAANGTGYTEFFQENGDGWVWSSSEYSETKMIDADPGANNSDITYAGVGTLHFSVDVKQANAVSTRPFLAF